MLRIQEVALDIPKIYPACGKQNNIFLRTSLRDRNSNKLCANFSQSNNGQSN